ncbi:SCO4225 family membrane protein [Micromonosporaceae bacterium Da 78-11]
MRIVRWFVGGWVSRTYLLLVAAVSTYVLVSMSMRMAQSGYTDSQPELVLLPLSMPGALLALPMINRIGGPWWLSLAVCVAVGALSNAALINGVAALLRKSRLRRAEEAGRRQLR